MSTTAMRSLVALSCVLAAAGFLLPLWPLSLFGVAIAAFFGNWIIALLLGLVLDIAFGSPVGTWHALYFPCTIFALVCTLARHYLSSQLRKSSYDTL